MESTTTKNAKDQALAWQEKNIFLQLRTNKNHPELQHNYKFAKVYQNSIPCWISRRFWFANLKIRFLIFQNGELSKICHAYFQLVLFINWWNDTTSQTLRLWLSPWMKPCFYNSPQTFTDLGFSSEVVEQTRLELLVWIWFPIVLYGKINKRYL